MDSSEDDARSKYVRLIRVKTMVLVMESTMADTDALAALAGRGKIAPMTSTNAFMIMLVAIHQLLAMVTTLLAASPVVRARQDFAAHREPAHAGQHTVQMFRFVNLIVKVRPCAIAAAIAATKEVAPVWQPPATAKFVC
eukprot:SAG31_NODE_25714_length_456_cov_0.582633_1_plen_139_part_00